MWIISGNKRLAYQRIPARDLLFSMMEEEKGKHCGTLQTLFLKVIFIKFYTFNIIITVLLREPKMGETFYHIRSLTTVED